MLLQFVQRFHFQADDEVVDLLHQLRGGLGVVPFPPRAPAGQAHDAPVEVSVPVHGEHALDAGRVAQLVQRHGRSGGHGGGLVREHSGFEILRFTGDLAGTQRIVVGLPQRWDDFGIAGADQPFDHRQSGLGLSQRRQ